MLTKRGLFLSFQVRNLSFHKSVYIRFTINNWTSYEDIEGEFVPSLTTATGASYNIYDTFTFSLPLPGSTQADKLEFCVCFRSDKGEFWDNNNKKNYVIVSFRPKTTPQESKPKDIYDVTLDSWTEFASWTHLDINDSPYWWTHERGFEMMEQSGRTPILRYRDNSGLVVLLV